MPYKNKKDLYAAQLRHRVRVRERLLGYLQEHACVDCGENDPIVLEFDHSDRDKKFKPISKMLSGHYSWQSLLEEIQKCSVRCANCHRRKTYVEFKSWGKTTPS